MSSCARIMLPRIRNDYRHSTLQTSATHRLCGVPRALHKIAPGFCDVRGLISKHFIWNESGWAGGVYQWENIEDAKAFYSGPWLDGIVERYGMNPQIEFYEVFAVTDNSRGKVELFKETVAAK